MAFSYLTGHTAQKNVLYMPLFHQIVWDRLFEKTFSTSDSTDASAVCSYYRDNFSAVPVGDTLSTYPSAGLKTKAFAVSSHLRMSGQSYLEHLRGDMTGSVKMMEDLFFFGEHFKLIWFDEKGRINLR